VTLVGQLLVRLPEEISALAALVASDETPYITGTELNIDGGILAGSVASPHAVDA
jgi:NAD(P)-dependent dehydrogenase (short-subunit alcohol dehydrogenase family)